MRSGGRLFHNWIAEGRTKCRCAYIVTVCLIWWFRKMELWESSLQCG